MHSSRIPANWRKALKYGAIALGAYVWGHIIVSAVRTANEPKPAAAAVAPLPDSLPAQPIAEEPAASGLPNTNGDTTASITQPVAPAPPSVPTATTPMAPEPVTTEPKAKSKAPTVYVTRTGTHYHRSGCSSLRKSKEAVSLDEVRGYMQPCGNCHPPR